MRMSSLNSGHARALLIRTIAVAWLIAALPAGAASPVTDEMLLNAQKEATNWLMAGRDYAGTRYSPLAQVNTNNVKRLVPVWTFSLGVLDAQNTTPLIHEGIMYA